MPDEIDRSAQDVDQQRRTAHEITIRKAEAREKERVLHHKIMTVIHQNHREAIGEEQRRHAEAMKGIK